MTLRSHDWYARFLRLALLERKAKVEAISEELYVLAEPLNLAAMFDEFVAEVRRDVHFKSDSYTHDNGFDKIVLFEDLETRMKMRLHIWYPVPGEARRARQNVHNHRWDFSSIVLLGKVEQATYRFAEVNEDGEELFHYRYYARGEKEHYDLEELGKARVVETKRDVFSRGELYCVRNEVLHRVDVEDRVTVATLIITHENVGWVTNDLLSESSMGNRAVQLPSPAMTRERVEAKVTNLRQLLGL